MTSKEALEKLDHTICLNTGIKWGVDDLDHIDCQTQEEAIKCIDAIRKDLEILKKYIYNARKKGVVRKLSSRDEMIAEIRQLNLDIAFAKRNGDKEERDCLILKKAELLKQLAIYDSKM